MTRKNSSYYGGYSDEYIRSLLKRVDQEIDKAEKLVRDSYYEYDLYKSNLYKHNKEIKKDWASPRPPVKPRKTTPPRRPIPARLTGRKIYPKPSPTLVDMYFGGKPPTPKPTVATTDKGKKEDMSYTSREEHEDLGAGDGSVAGAVYVRDTVNIKVASAAAKWTHASNMKYVVLTAITALALALISTGSIVMIVVAIALLAGGFFPHLAARNLLKNNKMIVLDAFEGYGAKWQQELHRGFNQLQRLTEEAQDPEAPAEIKAAFAEIEPVLWAQAIKVAALLKKLRGGSMNDIDADTKMILRNKFLEFKQQVDKIDEVFKIVKSYSVLDLDLTTEQISADEITGYLRNALDTRKALAAGTSDDDEAATALSESIKELGSVTGDMDDTLDSVRAALDASKAKQAEPVQALRKATA